MQESDSRSVKASYRNRVRECRLRAMIPTQEELARRSGIHPSTVSGLENNRLFLSSAHALAIRDALGCALDDLFERVEGESAG